MIEAMERFSRAAASFNARCVPLASVIVSRTMMGNVYNGMNTR